MNLCVLALYNARFAACELLQRLAEKKGISQKNEQHVLLPWVNYFGRAEDIIQRQRLKMTVSFSENPNGNQYVNMFEYWLAKYTFNGTFLGFEILNNQLFLCPNTDVKFGKNSRKFGTNYVLECKIELGELFKAEETVFYELFLKDVDGNLVDVPARILNYENVVGTTPNWDQKPMGDFVFVRRFFLYDNIYGYMTGNAPGEPQYIRWAKKITIRAELDTDSNEKIFMPHIGIEYRGRTREYITETNSIAAAEFEVLNIYIYIYILRLYIGWIFPTSEMFA